MAKRARSLGSDIISNLPTKIRDNILANLPLREAVRATILSKKWRHCWIKLPNLVFDDSLCPMSTSNNILLARYKLISVINRILLLHHGPILKFSLSHTLLENGPEIDHIISFLSTSRVEEFDLKIRTLTKSIYKLPSSFFSCQELKHLDLYACIFSPPPEFQGFPKLISLKFTYITFSTCFSVNFISKCPVLERLTLIHVNGYHQFQISSPKLEYLCFKESRLRLYFKSVPRLKSASIQPATNYHGGNGSFVDFFDCIPPVKKLVMNQTFLELLAANGVPKKLPTFTNLKILQLNQISCHDEDKLSCFYRLISSFPNIQRLEIEMSPVLIEYAAPGMNLLKAYEYAAEVILDKLLEVCLTRFSGTEPELDFVKLILAKSPVLEKTLIKEPQWANADTGLKLLKKLVRFQRASPAAEIIFE